MESDEYIVMGFDTAGFNKHFSVFGEKEMAQRCANSIRSKYKSVRVVDRETANEILDKERELRYANEF